MPVVYSDREGAPTKRGFFGRIKDILSPRKDQVSDQQSSVDPTSSSDDDDDRDFDSIPPPKEEEAGADGEVSESEFGEGKASQGKESRLSKKSRYNLRPRKSIWKARDFHTRTERQLQAQLRKLKSKESKTRLQSKTHLAEDQSIQGHLQSPSAPLYPQLDSVSANVPPLGLGGLAGNKFQGYFPSPSQEEFGAIGGILEEQELEWDNFELEKPEIENRSIQRSSVNPQGNTVQATVPSILAEGTGARPKEIKRTSQVTGHFPTGQTTSRFISLGALGGEETKVIQVTSPSPVIKQEDEEVKRGHLGATDQQVGALIVPPENNLGRIPGQEAEDHSKVLGLKEQARDGQCVGKDCGTGQILVTEMAGGNKQPGGQIEARETEQRAPMVPRIQLDLGPLAEYLGNVQQQQAISLLQNVQPFSGTSAFGGKSPRFDSWIRNFESIISMAVWTEQKKLKLLSSKLVLVAADELEDYLRSRNECDVTFQDVKEYLTHRFHGSETRNTHAIEYRDCILQPGEMILDYLSRLKKLFYMVYPLTDRERTNPDVLHKCEAILKDKFVDGLPIELRCKLKRKTHLSLEGLAKLAISHSDSYEEEIRAKKEADYIASIHQKHASAVENKIPEVISKLSDQMESNSKETKQLLEGVLQLMSQFQMSLTKAPPERRTRPTYDGNSSSIVCHFCRKEGHILRYCKVYQEAKRNAVGVCSSCGRAGHSAADCRSTQGQRADNGLLRGTPQTNPLNSENE